MDSVTALKAKLDDLRPLSADQMEALWPHWRAEDALFVYATNAIEGSSLTLGETIAVLEEGITIGGKPLRDHIDAVNGQRAFSLMLDLAQRRVQPTLETLLELHANVVGRDAPIAGRLRREPVYIRGSLHVPPNPRKVPELVEAMFARLHAATEREDHVVATSTVLHFDLVTIHPFVDGNGRTARLLQNLELIRGGYAPILISPEEKARYFDVLQQAQIAVPGVGDPAAFVAYVAELEKAALDRYLRSLE